MKPARSHGSLSSIGLRTAIGLIAVGCSLLAAGPAKADQAETAVVVAVQGDATLVPAATQVPRQVAFRDVLAGGDRLSTGDEGAIEVLVANHGLATLHSRTAVTVIPARPTGPTAGSTHELALIEGLVRLAAGSAATSSAGAAALTLWTPHARVTLLPGALIEVEVRTIPVTVTAPAGRPIRTALSHEATAHDGKTPDPMIETFAVLEGTIEVALISAGATPVRLAAGERIRLVDGVLGPQTAAIGGGTGSAAPEFPFHHTQTPEAALQVMLARESYQAQALLKVLDPSAPAPTAPSNILQGPGTWVNTPAVTGGADALASPEGSSVGSSSSPLLQTTLAGLQAAAPTGGIGGSSLVSATSGSLLTSPLVNLVDGQGTSSPGLAVGPGQTVTVTGDVARVINSSYAFSGPLLSLAQGSTVNLQGHLYYIDPSFVTFGPPNGAFNQVAGTVNAGATMVAILGDAGGFSTVDATGVPLGTVAGTGKLNMCAPACSPAGTPGLLNLAGINPGDFGTIFNSEFEVLKINGISAAATSTDTLINVQDGSEFRVGSLAGIPTGVKAPAVNVISGKLTTTNLLVVGTEGPLSTGNTVDVNGNLLKTSGSTSVTTISNQLLNSTPDPAGVDNLLTFRDYLVDQNASKLEIGSAGTAPGVHVEGTLSIEDGGNGGGILKAIGTATATVGVSATPMGFVEVIGAPDGSGTPGDAALLADKTLFSLTNTAKLTVYGTGVFVNATNAAGTDGNASLTVNGGGLYSGAGSSVGLFTGPLTEVSAAGGTATLEANSYLISLANLAKLNAGGPISFDPTVPITIGVVSENSHASLDVLNGGVYYATGGTGVFQGILAGVGGLGGSATFSTTEHMIWISGSSLTSLTVNGPQAALLAFGLGLGGNASMTSGKGLLWMNGGNATFGSTIAAVGSIFGDASLTIGNLAPADVLSMTGGTLKVNNLDDYFLGAAVAVFGGGTTTVTINGGGIMNMNGGNATFGSVAHPLSLFLASGNVGTSLAADATLIRLTNYASLAVNSGGNPAIGIFGSDVTINNGGVASLVNGTATFGGTVLEVSGDAPTITAGDTLFRNSGSGKLTANGGGVYMNAATGDALLTVLPGGLYSGANTSTGTFTGPLVDMFTQDTFTAAILDATGDLITLSNSAKLTAGGLPANGGGSSVINLEGESGASLQVNAGAPGTGGIFNGNGGTALFNSHIVRVFGVAGPAVLLTDETALRLAGSTAKLTVNGPEAAILVDGDGGAGLISGKGLLSINGGTATFGGTIAIVGDFSADALLTIGDQANADAIGMTGGTLIVNGAGPAIDVDAPGSATVDITGGGVLNMKGGKATFAGTVLRVNGGTDAGVFADETLIRATNSATLTINGLGNAIEVVGSDLTVTNGGILDSTNSTIKVAGTLADIEGDITAPGHLARVSGKSATVGGNLVVNRNSNVGSTVGGLLSVENRASVGIVGNALGLDAATFEATLNLVKVIGGSSATIGGHVVNAASAFTMGNGATTPGDAVVLLNAGKLTASSLFNLAGSTATITNFNLMNLTNSSSATLLYLFIVDPTSSFTLQGGSFAKFGTGTNTLTLTNSCVACTELTINGQTFRYEGTGTVTVDPNFLPFQNLVGANKLVLPNNGAIFKVDAGGTVTLKPTP